MSTTATTYKGYLEPDQGTEGGTWGPILNDSVFTFVDTNLGGVLLVDLDASNVTLTTSEARNAAISLNGVISANIQITNPANGFYVIENLTEGAFTVTLTRGVGSAVTIPQDYLMLIYADATNGARAIAVGNTTNAAVDPFPEGSSALFLQSAVPTGWTLNSSFNNYLLKLSSAAGAVTAGSITVASLFARSNTDFHTLTIAELPVHHHATISLASTTFSGFAADAHWMGILNGADGVVGTTTSTGSGNEHQHSLELRAKRVTTIVGTRNA